MSEITLDPHRVAAIRRTITQEVLNALGLPRQWRGRVLVDALLWLPTRRFAHQMARFDAEIARSGIAAAARHLLAGYVNQVLVWGIEHIPPQGPVLLAGNHPGGYDTFAVLAGLPRPDLCMVVSGVDFTRSLPEASQRLIYVNADPGVRMMAVRQSLRHLRQGGVLFIFPTGLVDPDPTLWPDQALQALQNWSGSLEILLRQVPETRLVIAITSHVLAPACAYHPITRLARLEWQKRRLAEYWQIFQQLWLGRQFNLSPRLSFSQPCTIAELGRSELRQAILARAVQTLTDHIHRAEADFLSLRAM